MGLHIHQRLLHALTGIRTLAELRIGNGPGVAARPAIVALVHKRVDRFGRDVVAKQIAPIVRGPDLLIPGIGRQANGVAQSLREEVPV